MRFKAATVRPLFVLCFALALLVLLGFQEDVALINEFKNSKGMGVLGKVTSSWTEEIEGVLKESTVVDSSTGTLFLGEPFRSYKGERIFVPGWKRDIAVRENWKRPDNATSSCDKWAVVTTIFPPTEAVKRTAALPGWCTVIVADVKTPKDYVAQASFSNEQDSVVFLTVEDQEKWAQEDGRVGTFVRLLPYRHFARKNLGFLYAIQHGAEFVFDFDDDNILDKAGEHVVSPLPNETHLEGVRAIVLGHKTLNHHPLMGASIGTSWSRGFPLESVQDTTMHGEVAFERDVFPMDRIGVMQFCAQDNPDIDAVHRLVKPLPMRFKLQEEGGKPLVVPSRVFSPYNAQATVHTAKAFWAMLLPFTVPGRVSDIWRSYFAQRLFHDLDLALAFLPPKVTQDRNEHSYLADMKAELDLYFKTSKLIEFLDDWSSDTVSVPERMEELWIDLYERGYIEADDVKLVQLWLSSLVESGYEFPTIRRHRYNNVVLMGQYNFVAIPRRMVIFWVQRWREVFQHVQIRGDFNETDIEYFQTEGIRIYNGKENGISGHFSPMENLARTLQQYKSVEGIDGVMYIHDDAILNMTELTGGNFTFPSKNIIGSNWHKCPLSYDDARNFSDVKLASESSFRIQTDGTFLKPDGQKFNDVGQLGQSMRRWQWPKCVQQLHAAAADPLSTRLKEDDGSLIMPAPTQADFLYVPVKHADDFAEAAQLMVKHRVFLECGMPTIVQMLRHVSNVTTVDLIELCTNFFPSRGKLKMFQRCQAERESYGMYHPYKITYHGLDGWNDMFEHVAFG